MDNIKSLEEYLRHVLSEAGRLYQEPFRLLLSSGKAAFIRRLSRVNVDNGRATVLCLELEQPPPYTVTHAAQFQALAKAIEALPQVLNEKGESIVSVETVIDERPVEYLTETEVSEVEQLVRRYTTLLPERPWRNNSGWSLKVRAIQ